jgi:hypothetical protein
MPSGHWAAEALVFALAQASTELITPSASTTRQGAGKTPRVKIIRPVGRSILTRGACGRAQSRPTATSWVTVRSVKAVGSGRYANRRGQDSGDIAAGVHASAAAQ